MLDIDELVEAACRQAGSTDLGPDSWREPLEVLVHAWNTEAALNEFGVSAATDMAVGFLANRLEVEQWYARHPEIDDEEIVAPLFGLGMPRTGSTATSYLIAQDPARRSLRVWEAGKPCPPPETATEHTDPRIAEAQAGIDFTNEMFPGFAGMIPTEAEGPQECLLLLALDFRSQIFEGLAHIPTYSRYLLETDLEPTYRYHQRVLKLLQWRCGPTSWSLRTPAHMHSIEALDAVYPDARFLMTHRDIGKVLPSLCALYDTLSCVLTERPDPVAIGTQNLELWRISLERLIAFRERGNDHRFHDLAFEDVQRDPIGSMERLYADLGDELTPETRRGMEAWWADASKDRSGPGRYDPAAYGLDLAAIQEQFAFYYDRFDIPVAPVEPTPSNGVNP
ncbi:sulfotransferase family protein [Aquihabitans sp. McL0605]|uniref:sulfotransferase family protein n=1 Tax=Aquihabitans sp. McL0605 TaxID=3415671 RepID=UPI003CE8A344